VGNPSRRNEIPLNSQVTFQSFDNWAIDLVGPINPQEIISKEMDIITMMEHSKRWECATLVIDFTEETTTSFLFENIVTRFRCLCILLSDQGTHFQNKTIEALNEEIQIHHQKSIKYHPKAN
jgi:hypothetical protein